MRDFKIGDRVRVIDCFGGANLKGKTGRVIAVKNCSLWEIGVEFDEPFDFGHNCNGKAKKGCGRWGYKRELELIEDKKIVITSDGKETLARLYEGNKVIKTATANCSPEDTFNFETGAEIAFYRLFGKETLSEMLRKASESLKKIKIPTLDINFTIKPKDNPLKIEVGKKYLLKPYDEVKNKIGLSRTVWDKCRKSYVEVVRINESLAHCKACYGGAWYFSLEAFEEEYIEKVYTEPEKAKEEEKQSFKVGDLVKVINEGKHYPRYDEWLEKNAPDYKEYHSSKDDVKNGDWGIIRKIALHGNEKTSICLIELPHNRVFMIGDQGLEKLM